MINFFVYMQLEPEQVIFAPSPFQSFTHWHDKKVLVVGQGDMKKIAEGLGFKYVYTMEQVAEAWPLLDMVNHENRKVVVSGCRKKNDVYLSDISSKFCSFLFWSKLA